MTEAIIAGLQDTKLSARCAATEKVADMIGGKSGLSNLQGDQKLRVIRGVLANIKDSNHKVVIAALDALEQLLLRNSDSMVPHLNICFDHTLVKLGDIKVNIRTKAFGVLFQVLLRFGVAVGLEKLFPHFGHKNVLVREKLSKLIVELLRHCQVNQSLEVYVPQLISNLSVLVQDSTVSVRQGAVEAVLALHQYALHCTQRSRGLSAAVSDVANGHKLLVKLESSGVRPQVLRMISDGIETNVASQSTFVRESSADAGGGASSHHGAGNKENLAKQSPPVAKESKLMHTGNLKTTINPRSTVADRGSMVSNVKSITEHQLVSTKVTLSDLLPMNPPISGADISSFHPSSYCQILTDGVTAKPVRLYSEKDLTSVFQKISKGIGKVDDWQARMSALALIQGVVTGDGCEYIPLLVQFLRGVHEHINSAITDLRSVLSKEGCKTIATIASCLGDSFSPLVELMVPTLLKQVGSVSSAVMTAAANKGMMVLLASQEVGFPRAIPILIEGCVSKAPAHRQFSIDFLAVCGSLWSTDMFDRSLLAICRIVENGVADKSPEVRKSARRLFWVLFDRQSSTWRDSMQQLLRGVDPNTGRAILAECFPHLGGGPSQKDGSGSNELRDLLLHLHPGNARTDLLATDMGSKQPEPRPATTKPRPKPALSAAATISDFDLAGGSASEVVEPVSKAPSAKSRTRVVALKPPAQTAPEAAPLAKTGPVRLGSGGPRRLNAPSGSNATTVKLRPSESRVEEASVASIDRDVPDGKRMTVADYMKTVDRSATTSIDSDSGIESVCSDTAESRRVVAAPAATNTASVAASSSLAGGARRMLLQPPPAAAELPAPADPVKTERVAAPVSNKSLVKSMQQSVDHWDSNTNTAPVLQSRAGAVSIDDARKLLGDKHWENRVSAVESLHLMIMEHVDSETSYSPELWVVLEGVIVALADVHHRVTSEALNCITLFIDNFHTLCPDANLGTTAANSASVAKFISACLPELFQRLLDQRPHIRSIANTLLNSVRITVDPVMIMTAIVPKVSEVPDKVKTAVTQFLLVIVPHCGQYFAVAAHSATFLGRMAIVLGTSSSKPSVTLTQSGTKLMEMVYKVCPQMICLQIALLPLQPQLTLKKILQSSVPDIDALVTAAGKEFNRNSFSAVQERPSSAVTVPKTSLLSSQDVSGATNVSKTRKTTVRGGSVNSAANSMVGGKRPASVRTRYSSDKPVKPKPGLEPKPEPSPAQPLYDDGSLGNKVGVERRSLYEGSSEYSVTSDARGADLGSTVEMDDVGTCSSSDSVHNMYELPSQELRPSPIQSPGTTEQGIFDVTETNFISAPSEHLGSSSVVSVTQPDVVDRAYADEHLPVLGKCSPISMSGGVGAGSKYSPVATTPVAAAAPSPPDMLVPPSGANKGQFVIIPEMRAATGTPSHTTPKSASAAEVIATDMLSPQVSRRNTDNCQTPVQTRDISWLLVALQISSDSNLKLEGLKELKQLAKQGRDQNEFWRNNCGQVLSVLLDAFNPELYRNYATLVADAQRSEAATPTAKDRRNPASPAMVTGFSPFATAKAGDDGVAVTLSPGGSSQLHRQTESMHISCKALSILTKYRANFLENFMELIVSRLCVAVTYAPVTIGFQCEQLLCDIALLNPPRFLRIIVPFASITPPQSTPLPSPERGGSSKEPQLDDSCVQMRLLGLHVLASMIKHVPSPQLLQELDSILASVLPSFASPLVDVRKAVVTVLCELYGVIGDALYPYIANELTPQQKKLLALYIQRFKSSQAKA